jgi:hypothetical protein
VGDRFDNIVFPDVSETAAEAGGSLILHSLHELGIVQRELGDSPLGGLGYAPGANWKDAVVNGEQDDFLSRRTNGMRVKTGPEVYFIPTDGVRGRCPVCNADQPEPFFDTKYLPGLELWMVDDGAHALDCQECLMSSKMKLWTTWHPAYKDQPFALGFLGITFWNWPELHKSRFDEFGVVLQSRVIYQYGKL